ncbi:MAG TPA: T9SS type A sorting domain-containing protein [Bacteroidia bacterium]|nr:T9SS type A sorting domain-containing protein [Bacteroidia bacterium]
MKTISKISLMASFCLLGLGSNAQFLNDFYHIGGFPADHSQGDKVISKVPSELDPVQAYIVAGVSKASTLGEMPSVSLDRYDVNGVNVWHQTYLINTASSTTAMAVRGLVEVRNIVNPGYAVLAFTTAAPQQSVVIRTDLDGNVLWKAEVGHEEAASLAYDGNLDRVLVLQRAGSGSTADLQLIALDAKSGVVLFTRNYDGQNKSDDEPSSILYDASSKSYLLVGTSLIHTIIGNELQIMLTRTTTSGALVYTRTLGFFGVLETAVSSTLLPAGANTQIAIGGTVTGTLNATFFNKQPAYTTVDVATGSIANVHVLRKNFDLRSIVFEPSTSSLDIVGNAPIPFGTEANLWSVDPTDPAMLGQIHIYNNPFTTFAFASINTTPDGNLVAVGSHRFPLPWAGSVAGLTYEWLITADPMGNGKCDKPDTLSAFAFQVPTEFNNASRVEFLRNLVKVEPIAQNEDMLDGCDLPFRLTKPTAATNAEFRFYPNPANDLINVEYSVNANDNIVLNVMDMTGRVVLTQKLMSGENMTSNFSVSDLASGVYYSDLRVNDQSVKKDKLVVQH